ncbi:hypothetical protein EI94DRAFT_1717821 [Lactarius quietus]|nr:hypothetical protein EI94DRAFT_1717821 [Lactarius quietus]
MPSIQSFYGAPFIGLLLNVMLTGLEIVQAWIYCWNYWDKDKKTFKFFIGFITVIDILCTALGAYTTYWYLVVNFGNIQNFDYRLWALTVQTLLNAIPAPAVQLYYVRRLYLVSHSIICPIIAVPLILGGTLCGIFLTIKAATAKENSNVHIAFCVPIIWMATIVLVDIMITAMMTWTLYRKRTGFARTDSMITTLMVYTINSGFLLSALGAGMTISFLAALSTQLYVAFFLVMSKCYMNTMYTMLNTRDYVRDRSTTDNAYNSYNLSSIRIDPPSEVYGSTSRQPDVTATVHRSTTSDFARNKSDSTFEHPKPGDIVL